MTVSQLNYKYIIDSDAGIQVVINEKDLDGFNVNMLNIGDLKAPSKSIEVLSVVFDLEGFTKFTKQVDPQLTIPNFISDFFNWLFKTIRKEITYKKHENIYTLWTELPFFSKFMGDGALFLWKIDLNNISKIDKSLDSEKLQYYIQEFICNIIATMYEICSGYNEFFKYLDKRYVDPPSKLRCGIARGNVYPIGNGLDFVGPCINISTRLQKFNGLSFAFSARGIEEVGFSSEYRKNFIKKKVSIRGIGENEIIYVINQEFQKLENGNKNKFIEI